MRYNPALDGVRALAVAGVIVFHVRPDWLSGGFVGVDVFFVISGYLIASILLRELDEKRFSFRDFYARRVLRLLPNALAMSAVTVLISYVAMMPSVGRRVAVHSLWSLLNASNVFAGLTFGGYWGVAASSAPLLHTWSLAIEEQFYLLLPAALFLARGWRSRPLFSVIVGATVLSFTFCVFRILEHPTQTFYLFPTRAWELLMGVVLACSHAAERCLG